MAASKIRLSPKEPGAVDDDEVQTAFGGLLVQRRSWRLSWSGRLLVLALFIGGCAFATYNLDNFLSVNAPTHSDTLVIEGWIPPAPLYAAANMIKNGHYRMVITSGCLASDEWGISTNDTYADLAAMRLLKAGVDPKLILPIPSHVARKDRTYHSALAIKQWFETNNVFPGSIDVITVGPHARRSRLLYEKAFGDSVKIGIIPLDDALYSPTRWWTSSEGVREVTSEAFAYVYARFLFFTADKS